MAESRFLEASPALQADSDLKKCPSQDFIEKDFGIGGVSGNCAARAKMIGLSDHGLVQPRASWEMIFKRWKIILIHSYENVTRAQSGKKQHMIRELLWL